MSWCLHDNGYCLNTFLSCRTVINHLKIRYVDHYNSLIVNKQHSHQGLHGPLITSVNIIMVIFGGSLDNICATLCASSFKITHYTFLLSKHKALYRLWSFWLWECVVKLFLHRLYKKYWQLSHISCSFSCCRCVTREVVTSIMLISFLNTYM